MLICETTVNESFATLKSRLCLTFLFFHLADHFKQRLELSLILSWISTHQHWTSGILKERICKKFGYYVLLNYFRWCQIILSVCKIMQLIGAFICWWLITLSSIVRELKNSNIESLRDSRCFLQWRPSLLSLSTNELWLMSARCYAFCQKYNNYIIIQWSSILKLRKTLLAPKSFS